MTFLDRPRMPDFTTILGFLSGVYLIDPELEAGSLVPTLILVHLLDAILCAIIARHSGRKPQTWAILGLTLGLWGVLPLLLLPARRRTTGPRDLATSNRRPRDHETPRPHDPQ